MSTPTMMKNAILFIIVAYYTMWYVDTQIETVDDLKGIIGYGIVLYLYRELEIKDKKELDEDPE